MRLLLYILLLFAFNTDAQITSSVYSGARFGGAVDTGGGTYITLPGCSTQTEIVSVDHIRNEYFINGGSAIGWRNTQFYTDSTMSPSGNSACRTIDLNSAWMVEEAKYLSIFYDLDGDGEYEYLYNNSFLLTTDSFAYQYYQAYTYDLTSLDTMMYRLIFHDVPLSNSCPSSVSGLVIDASYQLIEDCKLLICQDTINIKPCSEEAGSYICITDDTYVMPIVGSLGGISVTGLYQELSGSNVQVLDDDGSYYINGNYSGWSGWSIPELEDMWYYIEVLGYDEEWDSFEFIGYGGLDPDSKTAFIEMNNISDYNSEWRIIIYPQGGILDACYPGDYGQTLPFTYLIIENPNLIIY